MTENNNINYAESTSKEIDERFAQASLTDSVSGGDFEFTGVNTVNIYSIGTAPLNDYNLEAASNRYGIPTELGGEVEEMTLTQDKSFTFSIDRRNREDTMMAHDAGAALERQIREVLVPYIDKYRFEILVKNSPSIKTEDITALNAYTSFVDTSTNLFDKHVPSDGRIAFVSPWYYKCIKLDKNFVKTGDKGLEIAINGAIGMVDKTAIVVVPTDYLPDGINYIITHPSAMVSPKKLADYKTHENPQGINGWLIEGRLYFDAFIYHQKRWAISVSRAEVFPVTFTVKSGAKAIENAEITIGGKTAITGENGVAVVNLAKGDYSTIIIAKGYKILNDIVVMDKAAIEKTVTITSLI